MQIKPGCLKVKITTIRIIEYIACIPDQCNTTKLKHSKFILKDYKTLHGLVYCFFIKHS